MNPKRSPKKKSSKKTAAPKRRNARSRSAATPQAGLRLALAQINTIVGGFSHNADRIGAALKEAKQHQADVVLFPELTLTGYPPEDLLLKEKFIRENTAALKRLVPKTKGITAVVGYVEAEGKTLYNAAALLSDGKWLGSYRKMRLPNYGVFDEKRYFTEGRQCVRFTQNGATLGLTVCEDLWVEDGPGKSLCAQGKVDVLLNISSSPYHKGKGELRETMLKDRARRYKAYIVYANLIGGQDELVFDGQSLVVAPDGAILAQGNAFEEEMIYVDLDVRPKTQKSGAARKAPAGIRTYRAAAAKHKTPKKGLPERHFRRQSGWEELYHALVLGTRDYLVKNGFKKAVIGLSGGIDSGLTAALAVDALGADNVVGVLMPSPHSSDHSVNDSLDLGRNLNIVTHTLAIEPAMQVYDAILAPLFEDCQPDVTEENLQARIRGNLLMALSNKFGWLVLTTGNKSELSVGYCTLYGDMAGGFAVLKDVPKTWVYELSRWVNLKEGREIIPENIITKPPSAELRPDQKDTDSLPPYDLLDRVLLRYIEEDKPVEKIGGKPLTAEEVRRIVRLVDINEYKRRQGAPGIKITPKAFGKDRRLPITNHFKG